MNLPLLKAQKREGGFTLLELLIVIAIIAILSIALVFMLNPAETLKKARDAQRISDLKAVKTALGIMLTSTSTPSLDGTFGATAAANCLTSAAGVAGIGKVAYSSASAPASDVSTAAGSDAATGSTWSATLSTFSANSGRVDGTGWIPVSLKALTGGAPISNFPIDPTNTLTSAAAATSSLVYRYGCQNASLTTKPAYIFEINTTLESTAYTVDDNKMSKDGGDHPDLYETGNSLNLLPAGPVGVL